MIPNQNKVKILKKEEKHIFWCSVIEIRILGSQ